MQRGTALFLLASGLFLLVVGVLVGGVALGVFQSGVRPDASLGLICGLAPFLIGLALVLLAFVVLPELLVPPVADGGGRGPSRFALAEKCGCGERGASTEMRPCVHGRW